LNNGTLICKKSTCTLLDFDWNSVQGDASYGGLKMARVLITKVHIDEKINIVMEKKIKNQC
jgi:hypothetical protein